MVLISPRTLSFYRKCHLNNVLWALHSCLPPLWFGQYCHENSIGFIGLVFVLVRISVGNEGLELAVPGNEFKPDHLPCSQEMWVEVFHEEGFQKANGGFGDVTKHLGLLRFAHHFLRSAKKCMTVWGRYFKFIFFNLLGFVVVNPLRS